MSIGLALAGLATIVAAAHPRGAKRLLGFSGTEEDHRNEFNMLLDQVEWAARRGDKALARDYVIRADQEARWYDTSGTPNEVLLRNLMRSYKGTK